MRFLQFSIGCSIIFALASAGAAAPPDWTHALVSKPTLGARLPADVAAAIKADVTQEYDTYTLIRFPATAKDALAARLGALGLPFELRDDFSTLQLPNVVIDVRKPLPEGSDRITAYPDPGAGLYVVQLVGPPIAEWITEVGEAGATILEGEPQNGFLIAAAGDVAAKLRALPFVQFVDFYHPFEKHTELIAATNVVPAIVEIANVPGRDRVVSAIKRSAPDARIEAYANDFLVHAHLSGATLRQIARDQLVIGIHHEPNFRPSDERQALSGSPNITGNGGSPTGPGYLAWLQSACPLCLCIGPRCQNLNGAGFWVGTADTGLDDGSGMQAHVDLAGREHFGTTYRSDGDQCALGCDYVGHGTMVAGIAAGNAASGAQDGLGYLSGMGIAPGAGIFSTKFISSTGADPGTTIFDWAHDARRNSVYIQNHSHNDYPGAGFGNVSGQYTLSSRQFDIAVRDSNGNWADGVTPVTLTVSAGNIDQSGADPNAVLTLAPATAKNIISVGGAENFRNDLDSDVCRPFGEADSFVNLSGNSKRGTLISGYYKPDLVAPATWIVSTRSTQMQAGRHWCVDPFNGNAVYAADCGTSFAAPVAAGSALLARAFYSSYPDSVSPALTKAWLIAGARSMKGGRNTRFPGTTLAARPNTNIGFGLISLADILSNTVRYSYDQGYAFTSSGQSWNLHLIPGDPNKPVVVVLVWSDAPGRAGSTQNQLSNNLDLTVKQNTSSGCLYGYVGNNINQTTEWSQAYTCNNSATRDSVNNVEIVRFLPGYVTTSMDITVRATSLIDQGVPNGAWPSQDFAVFVLNAH